MDISSFMPMFFSLLGNFFSSFNSKTLSFNPHKKKVNKMLCNSQEEACFCGHYPLRSLTALLVATHEKAPSFASRKMASVIISNNCDCDLALTALRFYTGNASIPDVVKRVPSHKSCVLFGSSNYAGVSGVAQFAVDEESDTNFLQLTFAFSTSTLGHSTLFADCDTSNSEIHDLNDEDIAYYMDMLHNSKSIFFARRTKTLNQLGIKCPHHSHPCQCVALLRITSEVINDPEPNNSQDFYLSRIHVFTVDNVIENREPVICKGSDDTLVVAPQESTLTSSFALRQQSRTVPQVGPNTCVIPSVTLNILQYNVFLRPYVVSYDGQHERAERIPKCIVEAVTPLGQRLQTDVVVLNEAFIETNVLESEFAKCGFAYHTAAVGSWTAPCNSGIMIFSKHPIVEQNSIVFGMSNASGSDALAAKGVVHAEIVKSTVEGIPCSFHVFATHLQAWNDPKSFSVRKKQLRILKGFVRQYCLSPLDIVLFCGDFNIPSRDSLQVDALSSLNLVWPSFQGGCGTQLPTNELAGRDGGKFETECGDWIDYIFSSSEHRLPATGHGVSLWALPDFRSRDSFEVPWSRWTRTKKALTDLSDHYPVFCSLTFPLFPPNAANERFKAVHVR